MLFLHHESITDRSGRVQAEEVTNQAFQAATPDPLRHDAAPLVHMFNSERLEDVLRIGSLAAQQVSAVLCCSISCLMHAEIFRTFHDAMRSFMWHKDQKAVCALVLAIVKEAQIS